VKKVLEREQIFQSTLFKEEVEKALKPTELQKKLVD